MDASHRQRSKESLPGAWRSAVWGSAGEGYREGIRHRGGDAGARRELRIGIVAQLPVLPAVILRDSRSEGVRQKMELGKYWWRSVFMATVSPGSHQGLKPRS